MPRTSCAQRDNKAVRDEAKSLLRGAVDITRDLCDPCSGGCRQSGVFSVRQWKAGLCPAGGTLSNALRPGKLASEIPATLRIRRLFRGHQHGVKFVADRHFFCCGVGRVRAKRLSNPSLNRRPFAIHDRISHRIARNIVNGHAMGPQYTLAPSSETFERCRGALVALGPGHVSVTRSKDLK